MPSTILEYVLPNEVLSSPSSLILSIKDLVIFRDVHVGSKHLAADINYAWPSAAIAVMGAGQAINIVSRKELEEAKNKEKKREELINDYRDKLEHPYIAAAKGYLDAVVFPEETRDYLVRGLRAWHDIVKQLSV